MQGIFELFAKFAGLIFSLSIFQSNLPVAEAVKVEAARWAHESSDLPVDERIHYGKLENSLTFAWMQNKNPENRCYLRLRVEVGSLNEEDSEHGMAHYLEHMAFNGGKRFAPGTLDKWLQNQGMRSGSDTNAHTNFEETVYRLDLAKCDEESLSAGLSVLRDVADGLLLRQEDVEKERGIIDREEASRDSAMARMGAKQRENALDGTLYAKRNIIGTKDVRDRFTAEDLRKFYKKWYRPEKMTLVVVGDLKQFHPEQSIQSHFASMERPTEGMSEIEIGTPTLDNLSFGIFEKELPIAMVSAGSVKPADPKALTQQSILNKQPREVAIAMLNHRIESLVQKGEAPFFQADFSQKLYFEMLDMFGFELMAPKGAWQESIATMEQEFRRALLFGFTQDELDRVKATHRAAFEKALAQEDAQESLEYAEAILEDARRNSVPLRAAMRKNLFAQSIEQLTLETCKNALRDMGGQGKFAITSLGNLDLGQDAAKLLSAAYHESSQIPVVALERSAIKPFAYGSSIEAGAILSKEYMPHEDAWRIFFANGITAIVKHVPDRPPTNILVQIGEESLRFNDGSDITLLNVPAMVVLQGGLKEHDAEELERNMAGKQVSTTLSISHDFISLQGVASKEDFQTQLQILAAFVEHPGFREEGFLHWKKTLPEHFEGRNTQYQGVLAEKFMPELLSNDPRSRYVLQAELEALTMSDIARYLMPRLQHDPINIVVVGDAPIDAVVGALSRTFGRMKTRDFVRTVSFKNTTLMPPAILFDAHKPSDLCERPPVMKTGLRREYEITSSRPDSLVRMLLPIFDRGNMASRESLQLLREVVGEHVRLDIREKLGAIYSPHVSFSREEDKFPEHYQLSITFTTKRDQVEAATNAVLTSLKRLETHGVSDDLLQRMRKPMLTAMHQERESNKYWVDVLSKYLHPSRKEPLEAEREQRYLQVTAAELSRLAKQHLIAERVSMAIVHTHQ